jgi:hypothetical protein
MYIDFDDLTSSVRVGTGALAGESGVGTLRLMWSSIVARLYIRTDDGVKVCMHDMKLDILVEGRVAIGIRPEVEHESRDERDRKRVREGRKGRFEQCLQ